MSLLVADLFYSIQGESTFAGRPCTFVRLAGCNLNCTYCDAPDARSGGHPMAIADIVAQVGDFACPLVEITGGEPLLQLDTAELCRKLLDQRYTVLLETNGSCPLSRVDPRVVKIVDVKTPSSGVSDSFRTDNISYLRPPDQLKFVIGDEFDFEWALDFLESQTIPAGVEILLSPATPGLDAGSLARWMLERHVHARLQLQLHKILQLP